MRIAYPSATFARLVAVKDQYDPTNLFRLNQNIPPLGSKRSRPPPSRRRPPCAGAGGPSMPFISSTSPKAATSSSPATSVARPPGRRTIRTVVDRDRGRLDKGAPGPNAVQYPGHESVDVPVRRARPCAAALRPPRGHRLRNPRGRRSSWPTASRPPSGVVAERYAERLHAVGPSGPAVRPPRFGSPCGGLPRRQVDGGYRPMATATRSLFSHGDRTWIRAAFAISGAASSGGVAIASRPSTPASAHWSRSPAFPPAVRTTQLRAPGRLRGPPEGLRHRRVGVPLPARVFGPAPVVLPGSRSRPSLLVPLTA